MALWRVAIDGVPRLARGDPDAGAAELLDPSVTLDDLLAGRAGSLVEAARAAGGGAVPDGTQVLVPLEGQPVWCAGVTYERSRAARKEESGFADPYDKVYDAERPELFAKTTFAPPRGPGAAVGIRADSTWDVPEPELGVVCDANGEMVAYTIGDDVSSRSIEGENPLYIPQAKIYSGSCSVGPCLVPVDEAPDWRDMDIGMRITRDDEAVFDDSVSVSKLHRTPADLADWLFRAQDFPVGVVLLTGTALVPDDFTLEPGDEVAIRITGLGQLVNTVERVGRNAS